MMCKLLIGQIHVEVAKMQTNTKQKVERNNYLKLLVSVIIFFIKSFIWIIKLPLYLCCKKTSKPSVDFIDDEGVLNQFVDKIHAKYDLKNAKILIQKNPNITGTKYSYTPVTGRNRSITMTV